MNGIFNKSKIKKILIGVCASLLSAIFLFSTIISAKADDEMKIDAKSALLMDYNTKKVLFEQNATTRLPIASMVKIMTLLLTFESVKAGKIELNEEITVSEYASSMGGSQAFLDAHSNYNVSELIKSIVVGSANDSCVALAERIAGSVEGFVSMMNTRAKELGMNDTHFVNCTGLPESGQYCCARDVALMLRELIDNEKFFDYSTVWMFDFSHPSGRVTQLSNTNKLIRAYEGCDGGKTGFTNEAMYCLGATAKRGQTRLISVVCGAETSKIRNRENVKLFNYGFANYETKPILLKGACVGEVKINGGKQPFVKGVVQNDYYALTKKGDNGEYTVKYEYDNVTAPIKSGEKIGCAIILKDEQEVARVDVIADSFVGKKGYVDIVDDFISEW